jgi:hypothetical protein
MFGATSAKLTFNRWPGEPTTCSYVVKGRLPDGTDQATIATALARELSEPLPPQASEGGASC